MPRWIIHAFAVIWLGCVAMSLVSLGVPAEGDGFVRGFNRVEGFLTWQFAALAMSVGGALALRFVTPRSNVLKVLAIGPLVLSSLLAVALVAIVAWAAFAPEPPAEVPEPLTPTTVAPPT